MEDRETPRMCKYGKWKTTQIMMATVPHVTAWAGRTKYHGDGFLLDWVYIFNTITVKSLQWITTNVTVKSPSQEAKSCSEFPVFTKHYYFQHSPTHTPSPNFFSPSTFCSNIYSSLNNIAISRPTHSVQFKHHADMTIWWGKKLRH